MYMQLGQFKNLFKQGFWKDVSKIAKPNTLQKLNEHVTSLIKYHASGAW